jgi:hypothetical protein
MSVSELRGRWTYGTLATVLSYGASRFSRTHAGACLVGTLLLLATRSAGAHVIGVSRGEYTPAGSGLRAEITLRADDALRAVSGLDADGDGRLSQAELDRAHPAVKGAFFDPLVVEADGTPCTPSLDDASLDAPDGVRLQASYACNHAPSTLHLRFGFLERLPSDHRHLATAHLARGDVDVLALRARPDLTVALESGGSQGFLSLVRGGIEHILGGPDHLAFLLALVLGGTLVADRRTRVGSLVAMLTAFTVGHSAALVLATLGGLTPGPRLIEPAVALSVAYVGAENLFARSVRHRWMLTLPFGFVHGFAFAAGLLPLGLARSQLPLALFGFNLGVETGQLLVLAVLLPPLILLRSRAWYRTSARVLSAVIVLAALVWFVQRVA